MDQSHIHVLRFFTPSPPSSSLPTLPSSLMELHLVSNLFCLAFLSSRINFFWIDDFQSIFIVNFPFPSFRIHDLVSLTSHSPPSPGILLFGFISIILNYATDRQKERFKARSDFDFDWVVLFHLLPHTGDKWRVHHLGKKGQVRSGLAPLRRSMYLIQVEYKTHDGKKKKSKLLTSGFWGLARHLNYVFELLLALSWRYYCSSLLFIVFDQLFSAFHHLVMASFPLPTLGFY